MLACSADVCVTGTLLARVKRAIRQNPDDPNEQRLLGPHEVISPDNEVRLGTQNGRFS